jgi:ubiquinone/menaquinone biosynthesis C-methylase UbiE
VAESGPNQEPKITASQDPGEIYQHPLAYLLGLEGLALLRAFAGEYDEAFTHARISEIRELLEKADQLGPGTHISSIRSNEVYADWAERYDFGNNNMVRQEQPAVWRILDSLPRGTVLDAACGTGRHAIHLAKLGHHVIGVDSSSEMLAVARQKLRDMDLRQGNLEALPLEDSSVDAVICGLALMHVPDITAVLSEFARVLLPRGHLIISDWRSLSWNTLEPFVSTSEDRTAHFAPAWSRSTADYLRAVLALGFELRDIQEIPLPEPLVDSRGVPTADLALGPHAKAPPHEPGSAPNRWALHRFAPDAANAAYRDKPLVLILHLQAAANPSAAGLPAGTN